MAAPYKGNGKYQQPKWFVADPKRSKYKAGEGIRWRYNNRCPSHMQCTTSEVAHTQTLDRSA